jgi:hypothetical protein
LLSLFLFWWEYVVRRLDRLSEFKLQLNRGVKPKNHCFDIKAEEFLKNPQVIVGDFKELREKCDAANTVYQRFRNSITAVNHYQKHLNFPKNDQKIEVSQTTSFKMAIEICQGPMDDPQWTQDRKSLIIFYKRKNMNRLRVATT